MCTRNPSLSALVSTWWTSNFKTSSLKTKPPPSLGAKAYENWLTTPSWTMSVPRSIFKSSKKLRIFVSLPYYFWYVSSWLICSLLSWKRLLLSTTTDGRVSVKCIAKTFASGKTEKLVYDSLASLDLPSGKVSWANISNPPLFFFSLASFTEWLNFTRGFHFWKVLSYLQNYLPKSWHWWNVCFNVSWFILSFKIVSWQIFNLPQHQNWDDFHEQIRRVYEWKAKRSTTEWNAFPLLHRKEMHGNHWEIRKGWRKQEKQWGKQSNNFLIFT